MHLGIVITNNNQDGSKMVNLPDFKTIIKQHGYTMQNVSIALGKHKSWLSDRIRRGFTSKEETEVSSLLNSLDIEANNLTIQPKKAKPQHGVTKIPVRLVGQVAQIREDIERSGHTLAEISKSLGYCSSWLSYQLTNPSLSDRTVATIKISPLVKWTDPEAITMPEIKPHPYCDPEEQPSEVEIPLPTPERNPSRLEKILALLTELTPELETIREDSQQIVSIQIAFGQLQDNVTNRLKVVYRDMEDMIERKLSEQSGKLLEVIDEKCNAIAKNLDAQVKASKDEMNQYIDMLEHDMANRIKKVLIDSLG